MTRRPTVTHKIEKADIGLKAAVHVHVEHDVKGHVHRIRYSYRGMDDPVMDQVFMALADATTEAVREAQG